MKHAELLGQLLPPVSYQPQADVLAAELNAEGNAHDAVTNRAKAILGAFFPASAGDFLYRWERLLEITPPHGDLYQQRVAAVIAKLNTTGSLSIAYFIQLAASIGYDITITEPEPFRAGINCAGDAVYEEDVIWVWWVNIQSKAQQVWLFRAGMSCAGDPLSHYSDPVIETIFNELKPAHTQCVFWYED